MSMQSSLSSNGEDFLMSASTGSLGNSPGKGNSTFSGNSPFNSSGKMRLRPASSSRLRNLLLNDKPSTKKSVNSNMSQDSIPSLRRRCASTPTLMKRFHFSSGNLSDGSSRSDVSASCKANAVMKIAQRSNGASVKTSISELQRHCDDHNVQQDEEIEIDLPLQECAMLAQWSVDAYYKVLISKYQGIQAVISAMRTFRDHAELQTYCCIVLKNLSGKASIQQAGGAAACIQAMRQHPHSIYVQSEAIQALKFQATLIISEGAVDIEELIHLLEHAKQMYLTPLGKEGVLILLDFFAAATSPEVKPKLSADTTANIKIAKQ